MIVRLILVVAAHLEVFKTKPKGSSLPSDRIESAQVPVLKSDVGLVSLVSSPELLHRCGYELIRCLRLPQGDAFLLLTNLLWGSCSLEALVVCFGEGVVVVIAVCS